MTREPDTVEHCRALQSSDTLTMSKSWSGESSPLYKAARACTDSRSSVPASCQQLVSSICTIWIPPDLFETPNSPKNSMHYTAQRARLSWPYPCILYFLAPCSYAYGVDCPRSLKAKYDDTPRRLRRCCDEADSLFLGFSVDPTKIASLF